MRRIWGWFTAALLLLVVIAAASRILTAQDAHDRPLAKGTIDTASNALAKLYNGVFGY